MVQKKSAILKINQHGILLVFPINNRKEPHSLWSAFFPKEKMKWEWDDDGDDKVANMWHLMKRLSEDSAVVYSKWYQGRATFFSRDLFRAMLAISRAHKESMTLRSPHAESLFEILEGNSPLSTKQLKKETELQGKFNEPNYNRGMRELFQKLWVVGFGEVDDGAFPSLAVGATKLVHEDLWNEASEVSLKDAWKIVDKFMPKDSMVRKQFDKLVSRSGQELSASLADDL